MGILIELEIEYDLEILEDFMSHFSLMCDNMESLAINLNKKDHYKNNIEDLFRIFHNIKSASGYLKLEPLNKLSELAEEVLEEARTLKGPATEEFIDWLLLVADQFVNYKRDIEQDAPYFGMFNPLIIKVPLKLEKN